ncbi:MAG TPA: hypothetical protein VF093_10500 [Solirubrobacterales bacterium]
MPPVLPDTVAGVVLPVGLLCLLAAIVKTAKLSSGEIQATGKWQRISLGVVGVLLLVWSVISFGDEPMEVTDTVLFAEFPEARDRSRPTGYRGPCPVNVVLRGRITIENGPGEVEYQVISGPSSSGPEGETSIPTHLQFHRSSETQAIKPVSLTIRPPRRYTVSGIQYQLDTDVVLQVLSPNDELDVTHMRVTCKPPVHYSDRETERLGPVVIVK